jgi:hypothetical protein
MMRTRVALHSNATLLSDLESIDHDVSDRTVVITLKTTRRCISPTFILRLSGTALYKLELVTQIDNVHTFQYPPLIDAGEYFLDAIALYCETFNVNNFTTICQEDPHYRRNVLNAPYSFTVAVSEASAMSSATPRWKNGETATFLPTRYQKLAVEQDASIMCKNGSIYANLYCAPNPAELVGFNAYKWVDQAPWLPTAQELHTRLSNAAYRMKGQAALLRFNICFMGDSHSRELTFNGWDYAEAVGYITFTFVMNLFPSLLDLAQIALHECSIVVIGYGQWPLSQYAPAPFREDSYRAQLRTVGNEIRSYRGPAKIFYRSENYNGLSAHGGACPSRDHRVQPAVDSVNAIAKEMCAKHGIPFIDLHHVIAPMWDAALDYSHPNHPVFRAEIDVILHTVFGALQNGTVPLVPLAAVKKVHETTAKMTFFDRSRVQMRLAQSKQVFGT